MPVSVLQLHQQPSPRPAGPKHDALHMKPGLRFCWCMCQRCFLRYGGDTGGVLTCLECPCQGHYNSRSPMYVPPAKGEARF